MTVFGKTNRLARKTKLFFFLSEDVAVQNLKAIRRFIFKYVKRTSFSLLPLESSCSYDYFCMYAIIDFLANKLVFLNTVTYSRRHKKGPVQQEQFTV